MTEGIPVQSPAGIVEDPVKSLLWRCVGPANMRIWRSSVAMTLLGLPLRTRRKADGRCRCCSNQGSEYRARRCERLACCRRNGVLPSRLDQW